MRSDRPYRFATRKHLRDLAMRRQAEPEMLAFYQGQYSPLKWAVSRGLVDDFERRRLTPLGRRVADVVLAVYPAFPDDFDREYGLAAVKAVRRLVVGQPYR